MKVVYVVRAVGTTFIEVFEHLSDAKRFAENHWCVKLTEEDQRKLAPHTKKCLYSADRTSKSLGNLTITIHEISIAYMHCCTNVEEEAM